MNFSNKEVLTGTGLKPLYDETISEVVYSDETKNTNLNLQMKDCQESIKQLQNTVDGMETNLINKFFPVNHVLMTKDSRNPETMIKNTKWSLDCKGCYIVGVNPDDIKFNTAKQGGSETINMSHLHTVDNHTHGMTHSHSVNDHTHSIPAHNHAIDAHSHTYSHTHGVNDHSHTVSNHAHSTGGHTLTVDEMPAHAHNISNYNPSPGCWNWYPSRGEHGVFVDKSDLPIPTHGAIIGMDNTGGNGSHGHGDTGGSTPGTNVVGLSTNSQSGNTTNGVGLVTSIVQSLASGASSSATNNSRADTDGSSPTTNSALSIIDNLPRYQTLYIWRRVS